MIYGYDMDAIMMCTTEGQNYLIENKSWMIFIMICMLLALAFCQGLAFDLCVRCALVVKLSFASQNLLRLRRKTRFAPFTSGRYSRFALVVHFSRTVINHVFDNICCCQLSYITVLDKI